MHKKKFIKKGFSIEIELNNTDYIVRANILKLGDKESNEYDVTLELRRSDIGKWDMLDEEHYKIESDTYDTNMDVYNLVMDKLNSGFFDKFINRYEDELEYSSVGFDVLNKVGD